MTTKTDAQFLALLVHEGLLAADHARPALASGDPAKYLADHGLVGRAQWEQWVATDAGRKPKLARYELLEILGEGGTARVWRARDRTEGRIVALKVLLPERAKDHQAVDAFVRESKLLIELDCPHIVKGYRVARDGDTVFCAMELLDGECLQHRLNHGGRLDEESALAIVQQIGKALSYLRTKGLVHRDVKPGNISWTKDGRAVLLDLGFAIQANQDAPAADTTAGTAHYIAPEQARGQRDLDVRADIYALGATLYHLTTGTLPFAGADTEEVLARQVLDALSGDAIRHLQLSPQLHYFIEKMMAKEKAIRFQDPEALVDEIGHFLEQKARERAEQAAERPRAGRKMRRFGL